MEEKIEKVKYALRNLKTLKELITFDVKQAKPLCDEFDSYGGLEDYFNQADNGIDCLINYLNNILNRADPPKKFKAEMNYNGKDYSYELSTEEIAGGFDAEDYCYWLRPLDENDKDGKWLEINMELDIDSNGRWRRTTENGYAVVYASFEKMMQAAPCEINLPSVKFSRI